MIEFVTKDVSRFYIKAVRDRMWEESDSASKRGAYATLATVLDEVVRMFAPIAPYLTERMSQTLDGAATTVHQLEYPEPTDGLQDLALEHDVSVLRDVEETAANARQQAGRKLRWPVPRVVVETDDEAVAEAVRELEPLILDRVNARTLTVTETFDELVETAEPQMAAIGPAFGGDAQDVMAAVQGATRESVESGLVVNGERIDLDDEMVEYVAESPEHVTGAEFDGGSVYVDTSLTPEIESEGYARDVIRRIQEMRKELDLDVEARIRVGVDVNDERVAGFIEDHAELIAGEVRADAWLDAPEDAAADTGGLVEEWDVEDVVVTIGIEPVG